MASELIRNPDRDYRGLEGRSITLPVSWWKRIDAAAGRAFTEEDGECDRFDVCTQLVRWSLGLPEAAPQPEGEHLEGKRRTNSVTLSKRLWALIDVEAKRRRLSVNKVFQAHLLRGLLADEAAATLSADAGQ